MSIRPMNRDIFIKKLHAVEDLQSDVIQIARQPGTTDDELAVWEVISTSEQVSEQEVKVGDKVIVPWHRVTPPIDMSEDESPEQNLLGVTSIDEVLGVIEDE